MNITDHFLATQSQRKIEKYESQNKFDQNYQITKQLTHSVLELREREAYRQTVVE